MIDTAQALALADKPHYLPDIDGKYVNELRKCILSLVADIEERDKTIADLQALVKIQLEAKGIIFDQLARAREALQFYADRETWIPGNEYMTGDVAAFVDHGKKARAALARTGGEK